MRTSTHKRATPEDPAADHLENALRKLVELGCDDVKSDLPRTFHGKLIARTFDKYSRLRLDEIEVVIDFRRCTISATTWLINHHNGDGFGYETNSIPWKKISELFPVVHAKLVEVLNQKLKREEEERRRKKAKRMANKILPY